ncbi:MAG: hypothetical protein KAS72_14255 [Phycisphaerales bacterium]|nr:hypothetical protein [Phycisphaerales bacterium]
MTLKGNHSALGLVSLVGAAMLLSTAGTANADWSWKSALVWSSCKAEAWVPGADDSQNRFAFGNTAATAAVALDGNWANANASALIGWGGGAGGGATKGGGFGDPGDGPFGGSSEAELAVTLIDIASGGETIHIQGTSLFNGAENLELYAFVFTGNPEDVFGPDSDELTEPRNLQWLLDEGHVTQDQVIFRLTAGEIDSAFDYTFDVPSGLRSQWPQFVVGSWADGVPTPGTGALIILGASTLIRRRRGSAR